MKKKKYKTKEQKTSQTENRLLGNKSSLIIFKYIN